PLLNPRAEVTDTEGGELAALHQGNYAAGAPLRDAFDVVVELALPRVVATGADFAGAEGHTESAAVG
ncbi:hypothetical protein CKO15_09920, partial [Halorhodospira abdelmalekii]|nr:hypothetical protein [Halorhodospira abdelmalekii]